MFFNLAEILKDRTCTDFTDAQVWNDLKTKFTKRIIVDGSSYDPLRLFPVKSIAIDSVTSTSEMPEGTYVVSPDGGFRYTEVILKKGNWLTVVQGRFQGRVCFNEDVVIPRINASQVKRDVVSGEEFRTSPWMSITPMEIMSQRSGIRRAKGHTIVAGLGMGWLLRHVAQRKSVKKVTLVETSQELLDWVLPRLDLGDVELDVVCEDARTALPKMQADVALVDIWMSYGGNEFPRCSDIDYVWCWGSQYAA